MVSYKIPEVFRAVLDTNVIVAALRSSSGASFQVLHAADRGEFEFALSVPLLAEYDDVTQRSESGIEIESAAIDAIIRRLAAIAYKQPIYYLWRPVLPDPKDDMVLELALAATASHIVTFNRKHLQRAEEYGIKVSSPADFIIELS
jgi:putative PIN family toxin of toxin-antitoxin system